MIKDLDLSDFSLLDQLVLSFPNLFKNCEFIKNDYSNNPFINYLIYLDEQKPVGILIYTIIYDRAEIIQIEVQKQKRRNKIASKMMEHLINICSNNGIQNITLEVRKDNKSAICLYKKYGFIERATRKKYYKGIDGILMEKEVKK